jgi:hypothetical protein
MPVESISLLTTRIHSHCDLLEGYVLTVVPNNAKFQDDPDPEYKGLLRGWLWRVQNQFKLLEESSTIISCNYNFVKVLIALAQTIFATATLYRAKGD